MSSFHIFLPFHILFPGIGVKHEIQSLYNGHIHTLQTTLNFYRIYNFRENYFSLT